MKKAFTMLELVFVIAVIGILAAIAIPKLAATRDDAEITRGIAEVESLRSAIAIERQKRILRGDFSSVDGSWVEKNATDYGLSPRWSRSENNFTFTAPDGTTCTFTVVNNKFSGNCSIMGI